MNDDGCVGTWLSNHTPAHENPRRRAAVGGLFWVEGGVEAAPELSTVASRDVRTASPRHEPLHPWDRFPFSFLFVTDAPARFFFFIVEAPRLVPCLYLTSGDKKEKIYTTEMCFVSIFHCSGSWKVVN